VSLLRPREHPAYWRSRLLRELHVLARWRRLRRDFPDLAHLPFYSEDEEGPVQREEALFLHGLLRVVRPRTVVEIGLYYGHGAFNLLRALDADGRLYSFDNDPNCAQTARALFGHDPRFVFRERSQAELKSADIDYRVADFVFLDGAHDLALNQAAFERLVPLMAPDAILAVHDTGAIPRGLFPGWHWHLNEPEHWASDGYEHRPDERAFVNWVLDAHPEFAQIHLHSRRTVRCGITLLQRSAPLPRPG
jgi:predicted O-methyltransferase YrrM